MNISNNTCLLKIKAYFVRRYKQNWQQ